MELFKSIWRFRNFLLHKTVSDIRTQFARSKLGFLWLILTPAAFVATYIFIFSTIMKAKLPEVDNDFAYGAYLCAGIVFWTNFSSVISRLTNLFIAERNLLKEIHVPASILPFTVILSELFNLVIYFAVFILFLAITDFLPGIEILYVIPVFIIQMAFALGIGMIMGVINVFIRDIGHSLGIVLHFWFWFTPIVYPISIIPSWIQELILTINPMALLIQKYQTIFVLHKAPDLENLLPIAIVAFCSIAFGLWMYRKTSSIITDLV